MVYGAPLWLCVTALNLQPPSAAPLPGMFQVALVTRLCGVLAPVGPRSDSGSVLFSGENQWFNMSSALENVYDAVTASGFVRCTAEKRMPWYHERPSLVSTSM